MSKTKHNKKRNIGIIYEFLLRHMSNALIEGDKNSLNYATKLIEKRFKKSSEIYKEFRIFNAIANTTTKKTELAAAIITESKKSCTLIDNKKLEKEKNQLIHDINYNIASKDKNFYYRSLNNYRDLGTIQAALNEWKQGDESNLKKMIEIEEKIIDIIINEKNNSISFEEHEKMLNESESNKLVYKIMTEKINNKYSNMSNRQKKILKAYALETDYHGILNKTLQETKEYCIKKINIFEAKNNNQYLSNKINEVKEKINNLDVNDINDKSIIKFLTVSNLIDTIEE